MFSFGAILLVFGMALMVNAPTPDVRGVFFIHALPVNVIV
jgi:hypothetical protein